MTAKPDIQESLGIHENERKSGNPRGTYFVVITLIALLAMVGIYFLADQYRSSTPRATAEEPAH